MNPWPGTYKDLPASGSRILELKACASMPDQTKGFDSSPEKLNLIWAI